MREKKITAKTAQNTECQLYFGKVTNEIASSLPDSSKLLVNNNLTGNAFFLSNTAIFHCQKA